MRSQKLSPLNFLALLIVAPISFADTAKDDYVAAGDIDEIVILKRRESDYSVITEQAQKILDVPGALGDPLMATAKKIVRQCHTTFSYKNSVG